AAAPCSIWGLGLPAGRESRGGRSLPPAAGTSPATIRGRLRRRMDPASLDLGLKAEACAWARGQGRSGAISCSLPKAKQEIPSPATLSLGWPLRIAEQ